MVGKNSDPVLIAVGWHRNIEAGKIHALENDIGCNVENGLRGTKKKAGDHAELL